MQIKNNLTIDIKVILLFILTLISSMVVLEIDGKSLFFFAQVLYCIVYVVSEKKINLIKDKLFWLMYSAYVLASVVGWFSDIPYSYRYASVRSAVMMTLMVITIQFFNTQITQNKLNFDIIKKAIKGMCIIQLIWCLCAFVAYKVFALDINQKIFVDCLNLLELASSFKQGVFQPSGLSWHPATLGPVVILSYFMFDSLIVKGVAIIVAFICGNATVLIGSILCVFFSVFHCVFIDKLKIKKERLRIIVLICVLGIGALLISGKYTVIIEKFAHIIYRISGDSGDPSADAHMRYYWSYPQILQCSTPYQVFFGYGNGCSGYPIGVLFGQYTHLTNWSVESDIMDILISRGIFGFITFYAYLIAIIKRGIKIDKKYAYLIVVLILEGITYNVQFNWCIFIEIIMMIMIKNNYNIFDTEKRKI